MSRSQQDQFIDEDDEEEVCPLCVEELDITDKNFRPCPCGYQICQFCYNNIRTTLNGLCPACRRPYEDKNIQWKAVTQEEMLQHKQNIAQQAKKKAAAKQKEAQKREADNLSRKHLAGLRVRQKNLVYVTGMKPKIQGDKLIETLRGPQYFGQYGDIVKIVVANPSKPTQQSVGVYITFARNEDAATCIDTVNRYYSDGTIRAQFGTTKYCSAYLRGETCNNRNCMFLHEPGDENERYTRQDLSSLNAISTQQPQSPISQTLLSHAPAPQMHPIAAVAQDAGDSAVSPTESGGDGPALPATANWGNQARRLSRTTSGSNASPLATNLIPAAPSIESKPDSRGSPIEQSPDSTSSTRQPDLMDLRTDSIQSVASKSKSRKPTIPYLDDILKAAFDPELCFLFSAAHLSEQDREIIDQMPPLFDPNDVARRREYRARQEEELQRKQEEEAQAALQAAASTVEQDEPFEGGSSALGGEPEEGEGRRYGAGHQGLIQPPLPSQQIGTAGYGLGGLDHELSGIGVSRAFTPQQHQEILLRQFKGSNPPQGNAQQFGGSAFGHGRHGSRFNFASDTGTATTSAKAVGNSNLPKQQSSLAGQANHFGTLGQQQLGTHFFTSGVQGPPPGLKTTGTPPVSGGGMFGQGHGFTPGVGGFGGLSRENDKPWDHTRGHRAGAQLPEAGKRELMFPYLPQHHSSTSSSPTPGLLNFSPYGQPTTFSETGSSKQKKKGKKHRHANTSSSGGGGPVDVADPSILQARMHPNGAMSGQGLYGGHGQGGFSAYTNSFSRNWQF